jgi:spermidine synthase
MEEVDGADARGRTYAFLLGLFVVSGGTALTYQTLWVRKLELVFGVSTFAISTVLAAFMGGLAIGGFVGGRYADRVRRPLRWYGLLEIGVGGFALLFPVLLQLVTPLYLAYWRAMEPGPVGYALVQFVLVGALLVTPTAIMGATLPLLARFATWRLGSAGDRVGTLYAVNTAGAVVGTFLCGFVLLPQLGLTLTTGLAAAANLVLGLGAIALDRVAGEEQPVTDDLHVSLQVDAALPWVLVSIGLAGFSALVYEVAWTRLLALMLGASTYTFSVMLLAFLVGIAIGGKLGGPVADRWMAKGGIERVLLGFAAIEVGIALVSYLLMYIYPQLPFWYVWLWDGIDFGAFRDRFGELAGLTSALEAVLGGLNGRELPQMVWAVSLILAGAIMTPPAILMGMHFPVAVRAAVGRPDALGAPVGRVYGANTLGGVLGAFLAGLVLLPHLRVQGTVYVAAVAELVAAGLLIWRSGNRRLALPSVGGLAVLLLVFAAGRPPWDPMLMTAGMYHYVSDFEDHSVEGILDYAVTQYQLVYYAEGLSSVVTVARNTETDNMWLANNGKVDASTTTDMPTQVLCSLLPMQFVPDPKDVLVIGLASGVTAGAVSTVPAVQHLDVVELEPAIREAAKYFGEYNHDILDDPRLRLINNDGRNFVLLSAPQSYDVIVSEPPNPWISGVSNLFTWEFWEMGKTRLKPGGVWSQWVQMYGMDTRDLRSLLKTFAQVYPHVIVYATIEDADLVLVGSDSPLVPSPENAAKLFRWPTVVDQLEDVQVRGPMDVVALFQLDRDAVLNLAGDVRLNTDDNMAIEYSAPMNLHKDTSPANLDLLLHFAKIPTDAVPMDTDLWVHLARTWEQKGDTSRAIAAMKIGANLLTDDDPRKQDLVDEAQGWKDELEAEARAELEKQKTPLP